MHVYAIRGASQSRDAGDGHGHLPIFDLMSQSYQALLEALRRAAKESTARESLLDSNEANNPFDLRFVASLLATVAVLSRRLMLSHARHRTTISAFDARLRSLRKDLETIEEVLASLRTQQLIAERRRARAHNAAQPCCRLPREILSNIFEVGAPSPLSSWDMAPQERTDAQSARHDHELRIWSIGATCSMFRTIIRDSPRCWTKIKYTLSGNSAGTRYQSLKTRLVRSKNCMFDLQLDIHMHPLRPSPYTLESITNLLGPHLHRCRSLLVYMDDPRVEVPVVPSATSHSIQHLTFRWGTMNDELVGEEDDDLDLDAIKDRVLSPYLVGATSLLSLDLIHAAPSTLLLGDMQVHNLTRLMLMVSSPLPEIFRMLGRCTNLEHLSWRLRYDQEVGEHDLIDPPHLVISSLISISIDTESEMRDGARVQLDAPNLEQFQILTESKWTHWPIDIMHESQPCLPSLRRIHLSPCEGLYDRLPAFLHRHPQIVDFYLDAYDLDDNVTEDFPIISAVIQSLVPKPSSPHPHSLQRMTFRTSWKVLLASEEIVAAFWHALRELPNLHLQLYLFSKRADEEPKIRSNYRLKRLQVEFDSRISLSEEDGDGPSWPCAWEDSYVPWD